jgi:SOS-response transcriptional repressor LexA
MTEDEDEDVLAPLTELQEKVLTYIERCVHDGGRPPSRVEIGETFDIWPSSAAQILRALARKDRIQLIPRVDRGIKLVDP